ncbi:MAG: N-acetyltransferase family protein [Mycobacterium leprae]
MHIRHLDHPGDVPAILSFLPELYESNFPGFVADTEFMSRKRTQLREAARDPGQAVLVAVDELGICGFIWLVIEVEYSGHRRGEVSAVHVAKRARNHGVGRQLMEEGEALLKTYGCETVHLMVTSTNRAAYHLYDNLGYEVTRYQMEKKLR